MPILIDGHNLIGRMPQLSLADPDDEESLARLLVAYAARVGKKVTVVFDPGDAFKLPSTHRLGRVEAVFAGQGSTADALIGRRVDRSPNPGEWLVVTSDQRLADRVARRGARTRSAEAFAEEMGAALESAPERGQGPLSPDEVRHWLQLFKSR